MSSRSSIPQMTSSPPTTPFLGRRLILTSTASREIAWSDLDKPRFILSTTSALFLIRTALFPFSVLKTRSQCVSASTTGSHNPSMASVLASVVKHEGFSGLYRGFLVASSGILPSQTIYYPVYEIVRSETEQYLKRRSKRENEMKSAPMEDVVITNLVAGAVSSLATQTIIVPIDVVSQKMMIGRGVTRDVVQGIWRQDGIRGFYKGFAVSANMYATGSAIWWATYAATRRIMHQYDTSNHISDLGTQAIAGAMASISSGIITHPLDVVKTRMQTMQEARKVSIWKLARHIVRNEGWRTLMLCGLSSRIMNNVPSSVAMIVAYEYVKRYSIKTHEQYNE